MPEQTPEQRTRAAQLCHCGHPRDVHDPCSTCECPFFRPAERVKARAFRERTLPVPVSQEESDEAAHDAAAAKAQADAGYEQEIARKTNHAARRRARKAAR